ncbi:hypothetical protein IJ798_01635 [Candidatus Saccharibacteria bacterium]|nr:hypothetical protein [Candidatus Saccharibacteria bacterium]
MNVNVNFHSGGFFRQIVNFIITGLILYLAVELFPEVVIIDNMRTLIAATFLLFVAEIVVVFAILIFMLFSIFTQNYVGIITGFIGIFFGEILALSLLSGWLSGFMVVGFWPKFWLALALSVFKIPEDNSI